MQGTIKNSPGPLAPPDRKRPRRKMTALSYSWTTWVKLKRRIILLAKDHLYTAPDGQGQGEEHQQVGEEGDEQTHTAVLLSINKYMVIKVINVIKWGGSIPNLHHHHPEQFRRLLWSGYFYQTLECFQQSLGFYPFTTEILWINCFQITVSVNMAVFSYTEHEISFQIFMVKKFLGY